MKRAFDLLLAVPAALMTSPIVAAAAIAVKLDSPGPALYSGQRVGRGGALFRIHKLRTMRAGADTSGPAVTAGDDRRITSVGRFLRRTKIDELPQLWNVIAGEMSLVGPRPEHPAYVERYTAEQLHLLSVRPGITGPATIAFIDEERLLAGGEAERRYVDEVMPRKLAVELAYIDRSTLASDLRVLLRTAALVVTRPLRRA